MVLFGSPKTKQRSTFVVVRSSQTTVICVGRPRDYSLVVRWIIRWMLKTVCFTWMINWMNIFRRHNEMFTQYQASTLEIMFHMRDNFFNRGVLMQIRDKAYAGKVTSLSISVCITRLNKTIALRGRSENRTGYLETIQMGRTNKARLAVCSKAIVKRECLVFVFSSRLNGHNQALLLGWE